MDVKYKNKIKILIKIKKKIDKLKIRYLYTHLQKWHTISKSRGRAKKAIDSL
jgi:hypothetical protein